LSSGSCFGSQATKRLAQTRFNKHGAVATGRARCAIRRRGALWHSGPKNTPLFAPTRGRLFAAGVQTFRFINLARYFCVSVLRRCISKKAQEPYGRILTFFVTSTRYGQGMVHDTQLSAAHRATRSCSYRSCASGQSTSSAIFRKCSNLFARSSISFVTGSSI